MTPYYQDEAVTIYHGDCRDLPLYGDVLVTDPPYGISYTTGRHNGERFPVSIEGDSNTSLRDAILARWTGPAIVFGSPKAESPAGAAARLVWHKPGSGMGDLRLPWKPDYEFIYIINSVGKVWRGPRGSSVLSYPLRVFRGALVHPHEKPLALMETLLNAVPEGLVSDPFMGSGTTLRAAKNLGRRAVWALRFRNATAR